MDKSFSVTSTSSFTSDQLDELDVSQEDFQYEVSSFDVYGEHDTVGKILVVRAGETLPLTTKYKKGIPGNPPVKFHIFKTLEVVSVEYIPETFKEQTVHVNPPEVLPPVLNPSSSLITKEKLMTRPTSSSNIRDDSTGIASSQEKQSD